MDTDEGFQGDHQSLRKWFKRIAAIIFFLLWVLLWFLPDLTVFLLTIALASGLWRFLREKKERVLVILALLFNCYLGVLFFGLTDEALSVYDGGPSYWRMHRAGDTTWLSSDDELRYSVHPRMDMKILPVEITTKYDRPYYCGRNVLHLLRRPLKIIDTIELSQDSQARTHLASREEVLFDTKVGGQEVPYSALFLVCDIREEMPYVGTTEYQSRPVPAQETVRRLEPELFDKPLRIIRLSGDAIMLEQKFGCDSAARVRLFKSKDGGVEIFLENVESPPRGVCL